MKTNEPNMPSPENVPCESAKVLRFPVRPFYHLADPTLKNKLAETLQAILAVEQRVQSPSFLEQLSQNVRECDSYLDGVLFNFLTSLPINPQSLDNNYCFNELLTQKYKNHQIENFPCLLQNIQLLFGMQELHKNLWDCEQIASDMEALSAVKSIKDRLRVLEEQKDSIVGPLMRRYELLQEIISTETVNGFRAFFANRIRL